MDRTTITADGSATLTVTAESAAPEGSWPITVRATDGVETNAAGGSASLTVTTSGARGSGDGQVTFSLKPNPDSQASTGTLTVAGKTVSVTRAAKP